MFKIDSQRVAFLLCVALVFKVVCGSIGIRCSHLNRALGFVIKYENNKGSNYGRND
ncbi:DUF3265 domain-containing protein [Vibrio splendidus]|uniref:DUF3265 domain-containing protein n=1 Tax=Vibrio splendidus TaxID=29497 RepID=A0A7Y4G3B6_VIBSP|nr:DUF3265 domain-containing protein [Vibrio splendidus]